MNGKVFYLGKDCECCVDVTPLGRTVYTEMVKDYQLLLVFLFLTCYETADTFTLHTRHSL